MISANVQLGPLLKKLRQVPREAAAIIEKAINTDAKGFVKDIVGITPPSTGQLNKNSHRRGQMAITADLLGLKGGRGKHQRTAGVFVVMSDELLAQNASDAPNGSTVRLFVKKGGIVYGCDRQFYRPRASNAEMYSHHQSMRRGTGRVTTAGGATRDVGRFRFIDQMVVSRSSYLRYEKWIHQRVGILAAGFNPAATALGFSLPAWIKKHGNTGGVVSIRRGVGQYTITITNKVPYGGKNDLPRRMAYVLNSGKRQKRLQNSIRYSIRAALKKSRLQVA